MAGTASTPPLRPAALPRPPGRAAARGFHRRFRRILHQAHHDGLTGLPNRSLLQANADQAMAAAARNDEQLAVLFIDLDRFKDINDSLGHATGDRILRSAAARVQQTVGTQHTVARLSGDEFTVVLEDINGMPDAEDVAQRIIHAFRTPLNFGERLELAVSPSIGISLYPEHAQVPTELLKHADTAMYQAKAMGRHTYQVYSESMDEKNRHRAILASALRRAIEEFSQADYDHLPYYDRWLQALGFPGKSPLIEVNLEDGSQCLALGRGIGAVAGGHDRFPGTLHQLHGIAEHGFRNRHGVLARVHRALVGVAAGDGGQGAFGAGGGSRVVAGGIDAFARGHGAGHPFGQSIPLSPPAL